jgi:hypothetical protein
LCWITSNLGADHEATAVNDATEASAGWYWQYKLKQGYKYDATRIPATTWDNWANAEVNWPSGEDPCTLELGTGWRIPTKTEWSNVDAANAWSLWTGPWNSGLSLHAAGELHEYDGMLQYRGIKGSYWSSSPLEETGPAAIQLAYSFCFSVSQSQMITNDASSGYSIRCIKQIPGIVTTSQVTNITTTTASSGGNVTFPSGIIAAERGVCWSTQQFPTIAGNHTSDGGGPGAFVSNITGLANYTKYYIRAYATTSGQMTVYGNELTFYSHLTDTSCGAPFTINHVAGAVAPVNKTVTYSMVNNVPGLPAKCWLASNLGANHQADSVNDATEASAGWYWQFNRKQGYKHDGTTRTPATTWITNINESTDWTASNDPCALELGSGWRIPTWDEWSSLDFTGGWTNWYGPWNSYLKLHAAGYLVYWGGTLSGRGSDGFYWSSTQNSSTTSWLLRFNYESCYTYLMGSSYLYGYENKPTGGSIRCIKD